MRIYPGGKDVQRVQIGGALYSDIIVEGKSGITTAGFCFAGSAAAFCAGLSPAAFFLDPNMYPSLKLTLDLAFTGYLGHMKK